MFQSRIDTLLWILLVLHSLYILDALRTPPPNIFTSFRIPINVPTDAIRAILLQSTGNPLPGHVNSLLGHFDSFEWRSLYIRFGHNVVSTCEYCTTMEDYALYAFPRPALAYLREIALLGLVTLEKLNRARLRPLTIGILVAAFVIEAYCLAAAPIVIPPPQMQMRAEEFYMWHDRLLFYRHLLFLILPVVAAALPSVLTYIAHSPTLFSTLIRIPIISLIIQQPLPLASLNILGLTQQAVDNMPPAQLKSLLIHSSLSTLEHLIPSLHLQRLTTAALMRDQELRARAAKWWDREREEADTILKDEGVKKAARAEGLVFEEAAEPDEKGREEGRRGSQEVNLKKSAMLTVDALFRQGLVPSEHWTGPRQPETRQSPAQ